MASSETTSTQRIEQVARQLGAEIWLDERLFEVVGGWVQETSEADAKLVFAAQSRRHAADAALLRERLPRVGAWTAAEVVSSSPVGAGTLGRLAGLVGDAGRTGDRLSALAEVLDETVQRRRSFVDTTSPVADGEVVRAVAAIIAEEADRAAELRLIIGTLESAST